MWGSVGTNGKKGLERRDGGRYIGGQTVGVRGLSTRKGRQGYEVVKDEDNVGVW